MRRGTKEMDILLMRFSEARLAALSPAELDLYEALLEENDQDLYQWITGQTHLSLFYSHYRLIPVMRYFLTTISLKNLTKDQYLTSACVLYELKILVH